MSFESIYKRREPAHFPGAGRAVHYRVQGTASWYGPGFHGRRTANGEIYDQNELTAAHKTLPLDTWLTVTAGQSTVTVRINDRGPYHGDRLLDLSHAAAQRLGVTAAGTATVELKAVAPPPDPLAEGHRPVLLKGSFGDPVLWLTRLLAARKLMPFDPTDEVFGSAIDRLVRGYQGNSGLFADGIVGRQTWNKLLI